MDQLEALAVGRDEFAARLRAVGPDDWDRPTPCEGWVVRDLVVHVLVGARMSALLVEGGSRADAEALFVDAQLPDDVMAEFDAGADAQAAAFAAPGAMDRITEHPAGDFPVPMLLGFRVGDYTVHAWDLARAIGADEQLDDALVAHVWENIGPAAPLLASSGRFGEGASGDVGDEAPVQARLLDATGRRP
jgi:uncharacterized protein (TIGR03086 family)